MRRIYIYISVLVLSVMAALSCSKVGEESPAHQLEFTTEVCGFEDEAGTKVSVDGSQFLPGDWIRVKIICPFTGDWQWGESTYSNSVDDFYLLKHTSGSGSRAWTPLTADDHCDINADYSYSTSPSLFGIYESQPTPYVYTASTWSEEKVFVANHSIVNQFCHVFHADQSIEKNYRASDLLWAQQYMQTGSWNVHLSFHHMLSCIRFTIDDSALPSEKKLSTSTILTVEGMPAIDQQEVLVGNYYAEKSKRKPAFGYYNQVRCNYADNGRVIGINVNNSTGSACRPFSAISNEETYRAFQTSDTKVYRLIVPPVTFAGDHKAVVWLRDGTTRYKKELDLTAFEQGKLYDVTIKLTVDE